MDATATHSQHNQSQNVAGGQSRIAGSMNNNGLGSQEPTTLGTADISAHQRNNNLFSFGPGGAGQVVNGQVE